MKQTTATRREADLYRAGLTIAQTETITGFGHRHLPGCKPDDSIKNKYLAGALSLYGVMGVLYGTDSPQHHAGTARI